MVIGSVYELGVGQQPDALKSLMAKTLAEQLASGSGASQRAIQGLTPRYVSRLLDLAFLPPALVEAILEGRQPVYMTAETLTRGERGFV